MNNIVEISKLVIPSGMEGIVICLPDEDSEFVTAAEIFPGSLVQICFGEIGSGGVPKRRYSY